MSLQEGEEAREHTHTGQAMGGSSEKAPLASLGELQKLPWPAP